MCCWLEQKKPKSTSHFPFSTPSLTDRVTAIGKTDGGSGDQKNDISVVLGYTLQVEVHGQSHNVCRRKKKFLFVKEDMFYLCLPHRKTTKRKPAAATEPKKERESIRDMYSAECP